MYVDDTVDMKLILPEALQNVHGVMWHVEPTEYIILDSTHLGHTAYKQIDGDYRVTDSSDRNARFVPLKPGDYTIYVDGFFKQTNPQPIVEKTLTVKPKK
ncbi:MAG: hypothetical protein PF590_02970 [Candidatus Delongbacteria bacterium]|nr:hypothetical protein [Candidatus Delongbacteria bacterium]